MRGVRAVHCPASATRKDQFPSHERFVQATDADLAASLHLSVSSVVPVGKIKGWETQVGLEFSRGPSVARMERTTARGWEWI